MKPVGLQYEPRDASGGRPPRGVWPLLLNIASIGAGVPLARLAWETAHYPGADNYAELALVVIGVPVAFFSAPGAVPVRVGADAAPGPAAGSLHLAARRADRAVGARPAGRHVARRRVAMKRR